MATFRRLLGFLHPYRRAMTLCWLLAAAAMCMTVLVPYLTGRAVDAVQKGSKAAQHHELVLRDHERHVLVIVALAILVAVILRWILTYARRLVAGRMSLAIEYDLRERMYSHLQRLELGFFDGQQTGQLMSRVTVDLQAIRFFLGYGLIFIMQSILTIALAGVAMILIDPALGLLSLAPTPFVVVISQRYGRRARPAVQEVQQRIAELTADAEENISGVRVVKSFAREQLQLQRFQRTTTRVFEQSMVATRLEAVYNPIIAFLPQLGLAAVLVIGGHEVIEGHLTLGQFSAFYFYLLMLTGPIRSLGVMLGLAQRATASGNRIFQILDREPQIVSPPGAPSLPAGAGHVQFSGVSLHYEDSAEGRDVLHDIDLDVPAGSTVALVGTTGSGKTSLVSLIARLYDVSAGRVCVDGVDVRSVETSSLRSSVAIVGDDPFLFSATARENIAYARPDATLEQVQDAARRAQAHDFIMRLPHGYDTLVGERGLTLSGGQRQRLSIARALLADPRVLVLDDATSSVDASTEQQIKVALAEAMAGRTTFVIAHRLSTIALADEIVVLDGGRIVAQGEHEELIYESELYRDIVEQGLPASERGGGIALARREREVSGR